MNINYEDIITKANARKEALIALGNALDEAAAHNAAICATYGWIIGVRAIYAHLDLEGRSMLPPLVNHALGQLSATITHLSQASSGNNRGYEHCTNGISHLVTPS